MHILYFSYIQNLMFSHKYRDKVVGLIFKASSGLSHKPTSEE